MKNSAIEWTDHTFNPWSGCTKVSPGCAHCYAETLATRFPTLGNWGKGAPRARTSESYWKQPLQWNKYAICRRCGSKYVEYGDEACHACIASFPRRQRVFCASLADWLDDEAPIEWLSDLLDLIRITPNLDWLLLTKRPGNWKKRIQKAHMHARYTDARHLEQMTGTWLHGTPPANVWIGASVEDQQRADERIPLLLEIPAKVRFLSCEPLLGPVELGIGHPRHRTADTYHAEIHWVICGGESGQEARPMNPGWARSLRDQCASAGVPFFFKQWGEFAPMDDLSIKDLRSTMNRPITGFSGFGDTLWRVGKKAAGRQLDGRTHDEFPSIPSIP